MLLHGLLYHSCHWQEKKIHYSNIMSLQLFYQLEKFVKIQLWKYESKTCQYIKMF